MKVLVNYEETEDGRITGITPENEKCVVSLITWGMQSGVYELKTNSAVRAFRGRMEGYGNLESTAEDGTTRYEMCYLLRNETNHHLVIVLEAELAIRFTYVEEEQADDETL